MLPICVSDVVVRAGSLSLTHCGCDSSLTLVRSGITFPSANTLNPYPPGKSPSIETQTAITLRKIQEWTARELSGMKRICPRNHGKLVSFSSHSSYIPSPHTSVHPANRVVLGTFSWGTAVPLFVHGVQASGVGPIGLMVEITVIVPHHTSRSQPVAWDWEET